MRQPHGELEADDEPGPAALDAGCADRGRPRARDRRRAQPGAADPARRAGALARRPRSWATSTRPGLRPKRTAVVAALHRPRPTGATTVCVDELGPVIPRTFPPAPGWSPRRPPHQGAAGIQPRARRRSGSTARCGCATGRRRHPDRRLPQHRRLPAPARRDRRANPDRRPLPRSPTTSPATRARRSRPGWPSTRASTRCFIPVGACWLNLQEAWWRLFRREAVRRPDLRRRTTRSTAPPRVATRAAQPPRQALGLGPPAAAASPPPPLLSSTAFEERSTKLVI